jgi:hypothetical protein
MRCQYGRGAWAFCVFTSVKKHASSTAEEDQRLEEIVADPKADYDEHEEIDL